MKQDIQYRSRNASRNQDYWESFLSPDSYRRRTNDEWNEAVQFSAAWGRNPGSTVTGVRRYTNAPRDYQLRNLCHEFTVALEERNLKRARRLYSAIQERGEELTTKV